MKYKTLLTKSGDYFSETLEPLPQTGSLDEPIFSLLNGTEEVHNG